MAGSRCYEEAAANAPECVPDSNLQVCYDDAGLEPRCLVDDCLSKEAEPLPRSGNFHRRKWLIVLIAVLVTLSIIGGVVGGAVGSRSRKSNSTFKSSNISASGPAPNPATNRPATIRGIRDGSALAAVSYFDMSGIANYRVYYQDESNNIKESAWDEIGRNWTVTTLHQLADVRAGSPLAAAVRQPPIDPVSVILYDIM